MGGLQAWVLAIVWVGLMRGLQMADGVDVELIQQHRHACWGGGGGGGSGMCVSSIKGVFGPTGITNVRDNQTTKYPRTQISSWHMHS